MSRQPINWNKLFVTYVAGCLAILAMTTQVAADNPQDWTYWRGPEFNGVSRATGLIDDWDPRGGEGSNVAWVREDLGGRC